MQEQNSIKQRKRCHSTWPVVLQNLCQALFGCVIWATVVQFVRKHTSADEQETCFFFRAQFAGRCCDTEGRKEQITFLKPQTEQSGLESLITPRYTESPVVVDLQRPFIFKVDYEQGAIYIIRDSALMRLLVLGVNCIASPQSLIDICMP